MQNLLEMGVKKVMSPDWKVSLKKNYICIFQNAYAPLMFDLDLVSQ